MSVPHHERKGKVLLDLVRADVTGGAVRTGDAARIAGDGRLASVDAAPRGGGIDSRVSGGR